MVGEPAVSEVDLARLPAHIAIIMDGNGRWAEERHQIRTFGHREGSEAVRRIVRACRRLGVKALTLYAFSEQNWERPQFEVDALMELLRDFLVSEREELTTNSIRLRMVGRRQRLPERVREVLEPLEADTAHFTEMTLSLAISYGGQEEILDAVQLLAHQVADGTLEPHELTRARLEAALPSCDVGPVDLMVRTGGEQRISNFLLWSSAYAELYFSERFWPEWNDNDLFDAIRAFQGRDRRFGRVAGQDAKVAHV
jgi:undecaprenyl diphosphate synthase